MTTTTETKTLRQMLTDAGSQWMESDWTAPSNDAIDDLIERFNDCPESLKDFCTSDWVNLVEPYTHSLLRRWNQQSESISALFNDYCDAIGANSAIHALEGECDSFEDGDDMNAAIVNRAMTWGAQMLCREIYPDF